MPQGFFPRATTLAALAFLALAGNGLCPAARAEEETVSFSVTDVLAEDQQEEFISLTVNHHPVGVLHVSLESPKAELQVTVPKAFSYVYGLCGHLVLRPGAPGEEGLAEGPGKTTGQTYAINHHGTFQEVEGHAFRAFNSGNKDFYLADDSARRILTPRSTGAGKGCPDTVAERETTPFLLAEGR